MKPKFELFQEVFHMNDNKVKKNGIKGIIVKENVFQYSVGGTWISEKFIFKTKEELIESL